MKLFSKDNVYLAQISFLILGICAIWYLFIYKSIIDDTEKLLAGVIASLGLVIGLIQIWQNPVNSRRSKQYETRYNDYRHQFELFNQLSNTLKRGMNSPDRKETHPTLLEINSIVHELINLNNFQRAYTKLDNENTDLSNRMDELLETLQTKTNQLGEKVNTAEKSKELETAQITQLIEEMKWHNEIRDILADISHN